MSNLDAKSVERQITEMWDAISHIPPDDPDRESAIEQAHKAEALLRQKLEQNPCIDQFEQALEKQIGVVNRIIDKSTTSLIENIAYIRVRSKFYGMMEMYHIAGGQREFQIHEPPGF